jgi:hypothetical protein
MLILALNFHRIGKQILPVVTLRDRVCTELSLASDKINVSQIDNAHITSFLHAEGL